MPGLWSNETNIVLLGQARPMMIKHRLVIVEHISTTFRMRGLCLWCAYVHICMYVSVTLSIHHKDVKYWVLSHGHLAVKLAYWRKQYCLVKSGGWHKKKLCSLDICRCGGVECWMKPVAGDPEKKNWSASLTSPILYFFFLTTLHTSRRALESGKGPRMEASVMFQC